MKKNHQEEISKLKKLFEDTQLLINEKEKQLLKMDKELSTKVIEINNKENELKEIKIENNI